MTPTPPRGFIALTNVTDGMPVFVRASAIVSVYEFYGKTHVTTLNCGNKGDAYYVATNDIATVLAAIEAATPAA